MPVGNIENFYVYVYFVKCCPEVNFSGELGHI